MTIRDVRLAILCILLLCFEVLAAPTTSTIICTTFCSLSTTSSISSTTATRSISSTLTTTITTTPTLTLTPRPTTTTLTVSRSAIRTLTSVNFTTLTTLTSVVEATGTETTTTTEYTIITATSFETTITAAAPPGFSSVQSTLPDSELRKRSQIAAAVINKLPKRQSPDDRTSCQPHHYPNHVSCIKIIEIYPTMTRTRTALPSIVTAPRPTITSTSTTTITSTTTLLTATSTVTDYETVTNTLVITESSTITVSTSAPTMTQYAACLDQTNYASTVGGRPIVYISANASLIYTELVRVESAQECCNLCFSSAVCGAFLLQGGRECNLLQPSNGVCTAPNQYFLSAATDQNGETGLTQAVLGNGRCITANGEYQFS